MLCQICSGYRTRAASKRVPQTQAKEATVVGNTTMLNRLFMCDEHHQDFGLGKAVRLEALGL